MQVKPKNNKEVKSKRAGFNMNDYYFYKTASIN